MSLISRAQFERRLTVRLEEIERGLANRARPKNGIRLEADRRSHVQRTRQRLDLRQHSGRDGRVRPVNPAAI